MNINSAASHISRLLRWMAVVVAATATALALLILPTAPLSPATLPQASADPCPEIEVVFGRGQGEAPGLGAIGDAFVKAIQMKSGRPIASYAINYPPRTSTSPRVSLT